LTGSVSLWPVAASTQASKVDLLFIVLLAISGVIVLLVAGLLLGFSIRYRRGSSAPRGTLPAFLSRDIEIGWTSATLFLAMFLFWWAGTLELSATRPAANALEIHVLARQWMWKVHHPSGAREIDELHVPVGEPVRLLMTSQDVIHSFFVPAFRIKQDVLPQRLTEMWFQATRTGQFRLLCAEFCGTEHSLMGGRIIVMKPDEYARWAAAQPESDDLPREGERLFVSLGCSGCHAASSHVHAPSLVGLYGRLVQLGNGRTRMADEAYLRDSILLPKQDIATGYDPIMPTYSGVVDEGDIQRLVAYLMSLRHADATAGATP
jgi:cytochrome c oxidase subunit II